MPATLVSIFSFTITALSAANPAACATAIFALTPVEKITRSAATVSPPASFTPVTRSVPLISAICTPVRMETPLHSAMPVNILTVGASILPAISTGALSRTVTSRPKRRSSQAASSPSTPPPMTTAFFASCTNALTLSSSAMERTTATCGKSLPLMGGTKLCAPSA